MSDTGGFYRGSQDYGLGDDESSDSLRDKENSFYRSEGKKDTAAEDSKSLASSETGASNEDPKTPGAPKSGIASSKLSGAGMKALENISPAGKIVQFLSNHKKGGAAAGGITSLIVIFALLFGALTGGILETIQKDLLAYEDKAVSAVEKKASKQILKSIMCRKVSGAAAAALNCRKVKSSEGDNNEEEQQAEDATDPMAAEIDNFNINDPNIESALKNQNISINRDANGDFAGFTDDLTGQPITADELSGNAMNARFEAAIPEWDVGQEVTFRSLMIEHVQGASFDVIGSPEDPAEKDIQDTVEGIDNNSGQLAEAEAEDSNQSQTNQTPAEQQAAAQEQTATTDTNKILSAAEDASNNGASEATAINDAEKAFASEGLGGLAKGLAFTAFTELCSIYNITQSSSASRVPTIISYLVRHGTTLISLSDELKTGGKISGKQYAQIISLFAGNSSAKNSPDINVQESSYSFDKSAAWQRISGHPEAVNTQQFIGSGAKKTINPYYTPDIATTAIPSANTGTKVFNEVNKYINDFGGHFACKVVSGPFGFLVGLGMTIGQFAADDLSFGASQVAVMAGVTSLQEALQHFVIPSIVKYFTPVGINGLEDAVQWMNNADAGTNLAFNMYAQRMGAEPISNQQAALLNSQGAKMQQIAEAQKPFAQRLFSFSDPNSLVSRLAVTLPLTRVDVFNSFASDILHAPMLLINKVGDLLSGPRIFADTTAPSDPGAPYHITQYGFNPGQITKYDPISNGQYLHTTTISYAGKTSTLLNLLGDPNNYPNASEDNSTDDVLHCFTQGFTKTASETSPDPICGTMGNFDQAVKEVPMSVGNVAVSFCDQLESGWQSTDPQCQSNIESMPQMNDILTRFRQYLLDDEVTGYYANLVNNK